MLAALLLAAGPRLRFTAVGLVVASFAIGAAKILESGFQRPDYAAAARFIDRNAKPGDVVVDGAVAFASPRPLIGLDVVLRKPHRVVRAGAPQQRDHPFNAGDPLLPIPEVTRRTARGGRLFVVSSFPISQVMGPPPGRFRRVETRTYPGMLDLTVLVYADEG